MQARNRRLDDDKRTALIEAAMEEIAANGIEGASYNRIIERSGLSKGAVYYYFENKESLYSTVLEEVEQKFIFSVGRFKMPQTVEEFWPFCRMYYEKAVRFGFENMDMVKVVRSLLEPVAEGKKNGEIYRNFRKIDRWTSRLLRRGQKLGAVRRDAPEDLLKQVLHAAGHAIDSWFFERLQKEPENAAIDSFLNFALDMFERILSPGGTV
ncbi:MAG: TetR/AcrR family transcriptional regulator [Aminivibrio sp.]